MIQPRLLVLLLLTGGVCLPGGAIAQSRFFTTTGVSLAFPMAGLRSATRQGRGTTVNIEYRITSTVSIAAAWDNNTLPVQSANLLGKLEPALRGTITELKGDYSTNALGLSGIRYFKCGLVRPYLTVGAGLNIITVPAPAYSAQTQLLALESASNPTFFAVAGCGMNWQFSRPVALFSEAALYVVPAGSPVTDGANNYLTLKMGLRFPLF